MSMNCASCRAVTSRTSSPRTSSLRGRRGGRNTTSPTLDSGSHPGAGGPVGAVRLVLATPGGPSSTLGLPRLRPEDGRLPRPGPARHLTLTPRRDRPPPHQPQAEAVRSPAPGAAHGVAVPVLGAVGGVLQRMPDVRGAPARAGEGAHQAGPALVADLAQGGVHGQGGGKPRRLAGVLGWCAHLPAPRQRRPAVGIRPVASAGRTGGVPTTT